MPSETTYIGPKMKTPSEKPKEYRVTLKNAAGAASTTPRKMAECLQELGVPVDADGAFSLGMMFCAIRVNCDPSKARRRVRVVMKQAIAKHFGQPSTDAPALGDDQKIQHIARAWSVGAQP